MWLVGICPYCGTVLALQAPSLTVSTVFNREIYCPACFDGRPTLWKPARADQLDTVYNTLRSKWLAQHNCNPSTANYLQIGGGADGTATVETPKSSGDTGQAAAWGSRSPWHFTDGKNNDE